MKWIIENKISSGLGLMLMIVVIIVSITYRVTTCFIQDTDWVTHSHKVIRNPQRPPPHDAGSCADYKETLHEQQSHPAGPAELI
jgi:hypothetical protein